MSKNQSINHEISHKFLQHLSTTQLIRKLVFHYFVYCFILFSVVLRISYIGYFLNLTLLIADYCRPYNTSRVVSGWCPFDFISHCRLRYSLRNCHGHGCILFVSLTTWCWLWFVWSTSWIWIGVLLALAVCILSVL